MVMYLDLNRFKFYKKTRLNISKLSDKKYNVRLFPMVG